MRNFTVLAGTASHRLAHAVAARLGEPPGASAVERFPDGEVTVRLEESVRDREVFVIQATSPPVNDHLIELLAFADACRRAAASRITAVIPYFGYARADRRKGMREPVMASLAAGLLESAGVRHVVTVDVHTPQIEGFFHVPVDDLTAIPSLAAALAGRIAAEAVVVSPDLGAVDRATRFAARFELPVAVLHKRRRSGTEVEVVQVIGDVAGRPCVIVDDMISTGGTIAEAARALVDAGARPELTVVATHGVLTGPARERLAAAGLRDLVLTDTVPMEREAWPWVRIVSVAPLLAAAIQRLVAGGSLRDLF